jgi:DNA replication protein DnaC
MLIQPTIDNLKTLKLFGMVQALETQLTNSDAAGLPFEDRFGMIVDCEVTTRDNTRLQRLVRAAKLGQQAMVEDVESNPARGVDKALFLSLSTGDWLKQKQNVLIIGKTGVGKSYLACALAQKACRLGYSVLYQRASRLFEELRIARADGSYVKALNNLAKRELLVLDDFGLEALTSDQRRDLLEVIEDRYQSSSTLITSQIPVDHWHELIGDPTIADAILDRVVHNAHKLSLKGESRRKSKSKEAQ